MRRGVEVEQMTEILWAVVIVVAILLLLVMVVRALAGRRPRTAGRSAILRPPSA